MASRVRVLVAAAVFVALLVGGATVAVTAVVAEDHQTDPEHEHPDEVSDDGDPESVQRWLAERMGRMHVDCTEGIRVGNFDACEDLEGERYESYLDRYVTVEGETTGDDEDERAERLRETRRKQQELATLLEEFNRTREEYRAARERGDEDAARARGRELIALAQRIQTLGGDVAVNLRIMDANVSQDLGESARAINETTEEVVVVRQQVEEETFVATDLSVTVEETASFSSPARVSGRVLAEDGEPVAGATIEIADDEIATTVQTDGDGRFEGSYRPTLTETGGTNVSVQYVPEETSPYLDDRMNATVDVQQTETTVEVTGATADAGYGDPVRAAGSVRAGDVGAPGVPVTLLVDDAPLATGRTDEEGSFNLRGQLPADVPTGETDVVVRASEPDAALGRSTGTEPTTVTETDTDLNVSVSTVDGRVRVRGTLVAEDAGPVADRPIEVTVGEHTQTVTTDERGRYVLTVDPATRDRDVTAVYEEPATNLGPTTTATTVPGTGDRGWIDAVGGALVSAVDTAGEYPGIAVGALGALLLGLGAAVARWRSRAGEDAGAEGPEATGAAAVTGPGGDPGGGPGAGPADAASASRSHLARARNLLATSPDDAVRACYAAVRTGLGDASSDAVRTHWEFYTERTGDLPAERSAALRALTEAFERATFAPGGVDRETAEAAVEEAERCLAADGGSSYADREPEPTD